jgi:hypothetical protein
MFGPRFLCVKHNTKDDDWRDFEQRQSSNESAHYVPAEFAPRLNTCYQSEADFD